MTEPCAYYDSNGCRNLREHNVNVARAVYTLFRGRLKAGTPLSHRITEATGIKEPLCKAALLAAVTHDLGKASRYYQDRLSQGGSFYMHEHVSAAILYEASNVLVYNGYAGQSLVALIAAGAVSRHHAAMKERHPNDLASHMGRPGRLSWARVIIKALEAMDEDLIESGTMLSLMPEEVRDAILHGASTARRTASRGGINYIKLVMDSLASHGLWNARVTGEKPLRETLITAVQTVAGALIAADILIAGAERRGGEDPSSIYALSWLRELEARRVIQEISSGAWDKGLISWDC